MHEMHAGVAGTYSGKYNNVQKPAPANKTTTVATTQKAAAPAQAAQQTVYYGGGGDDGGGGGGEEGNPWQDLLEEMKEAASSAYKRNIKRIKNSYNQSKQTYDYNLANNNSDLEANARHSRNLVNVDAENAMRQAYINNMLSRRDMQQWLTAQGLSGGASETMRASLENNYGNARNQIDTSRNRNLTDINTTYNTNIASAIRQYNEQIAQLAAQKAQLEMQAENQYTNNQMQAYLAALSAIRE